MYSYYCILNPHVGESNRSVIRRAYRAISKKARKDRSKKHMRVEFYMRIIHEHNQARELFNYYRF